jgi:enterochelin esterase-like enzyme
MPCHPTRLASCLVAFGVLAGWSAIAPPSTLCADSPQERKTINIDPKIIDAYVGQYELAPKVVLTLRRFGDRLTAQITGQPPFVVFPESETRFFWKVADAQFTMQKDNEGRVTGLLLEQGAVKLNAKKISNEPPPEVDYRETEETFESPRLAALAKEWKSGNKAALQAFWKELKDKAPLVEPIASDARRSWLTFVWRGNDKTRTVFVRGGLPAHQDWKPLTRLADTDLWYRTERIPNDARFAYGFQVNRPVNEPKDHAGWIRLLSQYPPQPDPLNPRAVVLQSMLGSLAELPGAPPQPWVARRPEVPKGALSEHKFKSEILKQERAFTLYTPPNYDAKGEECGLLVLFDGPNYQSSEEIPGPVILDNLIAAKKIPPLVVVFVKHINRDQELSCSESFADFLAKELVPWVHKNHRVSPKGTRTIVGGLSLGGLMAAYCGLRHPEVFGKVLSQSGSYHWHPGWQDNTAPAGAEPGWLARQFAAAPRHAVRFYLEAGRFEDGFPLSTLAENRRFRDVLQAKGYPVHYAEFSGGHDFLSWRGSFATGLMALTGAAEPK